MGRRKKAAGGIGLIVLLIVFIVFLGIGGYGAVCYFQQGKYWCSLDTGFVKDLKDKESINQALGAKPKEAIDPEMADWVEYKNSNYGYSFMYPLTHSVASECGRSVDITGCHSIVLSTDPAEEKPTEPRIVIKAIDRNAAVYKILELNEIARSNFNNLRITSGISMKSYIEPERTKFLGEEAYTYSFSGAKFNGKWYQFELPDNSHYVYEMFHSGIYYLIIYTHDTALDKIISTFRFTN